MRRSFRYSGVLLTCTLASLTSWSANALDIQRPAVTVNIPKPVVNVPRPTVPTVTRPVVNVPRPVVNVPKPAVNVPRVETPRTVVNVPKPAVHVPKPEVPRAVVNIPKPSGSAVNVAKPVVDTPKPTPVVNVPRPSVDPPKPTSIVNTAKPIVETSKPVPVIGTPVRGIHRPVPFEGDRKNGIAAPILAGGDTRPVLTPSAGGTPKLTVGDRSPVATTTSGSQSGVAPIAQKPGVATSLALGPIASKGATQSLSKGTISREDASKILTVKSSNAESSLASASPLVQSGDKNASGSSQSKPGDTKLLPASTSNDPKLKGTATAKAATQNLEGSSSGGATAFSDAAFCKTHNCGASGSPIQNSSGSSSMSSSSSGSTAVREDTGGTKTAGGGANSISAAKNVIAGAGGTITQTGNSVTVKLPNGSFGTATMNSDGTFTVGNNYGSARLTQQQLQQVAAGDMSPVAALMGSSTANATGPGTPAAPAQSSAMDILNNLRNATRLGLGAEKLAQEAVKFAGRDAVPYGTANPYVPYDVQPYAPNDVSIQPNPYLEKIGKAAKVVSGVLGAVQVGEGVLRSGDSGMTRTINVIEGSGKVAGAFGVPGSGYAAVTGEGLRTIQAWNAGDVFGAAGHASAFAARAALGTAFALEAGAVAMFTGPAGAGLAAQKGFDAGSSTAGAAITLGNAAVGAAIDWHFSNTP
ncbi:MAG: hypothetical protein J0H42_22300 [Rhizobiales bacterium]|nr:hypothetical protein [Hyphomicrobiales bacterium]